MGSPSFREFKSASLLGAGFLSFAALLVVALLPAGAAGYCIDYEGQLHWLSGLQTTRTSYGVAVRDGYAYLSSDHELAVIDVSDPTRPEQVGSAPIQVGGADIALVGMYAYVADYMNGILTVDVSDPHHPLVVGGASSYGVAIGLAARGDYLYLSTAVPGNPGQSRLQIFSIAGNAMNPEFITDVGVLNYGWDVVLCGNYAYVAADAAGVATVDISNPEDPVRVGILNTPGLAHGVAISRNRLCIADYDGFQAASIATPEAPQLLGRVGLPNIANGVAAYGDYACVGDGEAGLQVVNVTNPAHPKIAGWVDTPGVSYCVAVDESRAYVADDMGLQIIELSTTPAGVRGIYYVATPSYANHTAVRGGYAFVADYTSGLQIIQVSGVSSPHTVASIDTPGRALGDAVTADKAIVADDSGVCLFDITQPTHPVALGRVNVPGVAYDVAVADENAPARYAFAAVGLAGLRVLDVSGNTPMIIGSVDTSPSGEARWVAVSGQRVFMADSDAGLVIIDASDPANPTIASTVPMPGAAGGLAISGTRAFVADPFGFTIIDVADIHDPRVLGYAKLRHGLIPCMAADGDYIYISQLDNDVFVVDVSDPSETRVIGELHLYPGYAQALTVKDCTLYISGISDGLVIAPAQEGRDEHLVAVAGSGADGGRARLLASPNPMSGSTSISFDLPSTERVELQIFDAGGRHVRRLVQAEMAPGWHVAPWDGRNEAGHPVASGIYLVRLGRTGGVISDRLILLR